MCAETFSKKMEETIFCPSSFPNTSPLSSLVRDQAEWVSSVVFLEISEVKEGLTKFKKARYVSHYSIEE